MHGVDGSSRQTVVCLEQPAENFLVTITTVVQDGEQTGQTLDDASAVGREEHLGNAGNTASLDCEKMTITEHLLDA